jgi:hypothetical protein
LNSKAMSNAVCSAVRITTLLLWWAFNASNMGLYMRDTRPAAVHGCIISSMNQIVDSTKANERDPQAQHTTGH